MKDFIEKLKAHLAAHKDDFLHETPYAHGDTECGFSSDYDVDMDALNAEIDAFVESFQQQEKK